MTPNTIMIMGHRCATWPQLGLVVAVRMVPALSERLKEKVYAGLSVGGVTYGTLEAQIERDSHRGF